MLRLVTFFNHTLSVASSNCSTFSCVMLDFRIVIYYTISISIKIRHKGTRSYCAMLYLSICQASEDIIIMVEKKKIGYLGAAEKILDYTLFT